MADPDWLAKYKADKGIADASTSRSAIPVSTAAPLSWEEQNKNSPFAKQPWFKDYLDIKKTAILENNLPADEKDKELSLAVMAQRQYSQRRQAEQENAKSPLKIDPKTGKATDWDLATGPLGTDPLTGKPREWGISDETRIALGGDSPNRNDGPVTSAIRPYIPAPVRNFPAALADLGERAIQGVNAAGDTVAAGLDDALSYTGIPDLLGKVLPGTPSVLATLKALEEAFPAGGAEAGMLPGFMTPKGDVLAPEVRARLNEEATALANKPGVTRADYDAWTDKNGLPRYGKGLDDYLAQKAEAPDKPTEAPTSAAEPVASPSGEAPATPAAPAELTPETYADKVMSEGRPFLDSPDAVAYFTKNSEEIKKVLDDRAANPTPGGPPPPENVTPESVAAPVEYPSKPDANGMVKVYHGGGDTPGEWVTTDPRYAQQYADKSGGKVWETDLPADDPRFEGSAINEWQTSSSFPLNPEETATLRPKGSKAPDSLPQPAEGDGGSNPPSPPEEPAGEAPTPPEGPSVIERLTTAMGQAKKLLPEKKAMIAKERAIRIAKGSQVDSTLTGVDRYRAQQAALKGEMPTPDFEMPGEKFTQEDIGSLYDHVDRNIPDDTQFFDNLKAKSGIGKLLSGKVPTSSELDAMGKAFPTDFMKSAMMHRGKLQKLVGTAYDVNGLMKSMMSTLDLSAPLRQGAPLIGTKAYWKAFVQMHKDFGSEKAFLASDDAIKALPSYKLAKQNGLFLAERNGGLSSMEESFMSRFAERVPLVKNSERAYVGFLNKLRADTFQTLWDKADKAGIAVDPKELANYINTMTGRGNLGYLNSAGVLLNQAFFSPRLIASRVQLLNPVTYVKASPFVRAEMIKNMAVYSGLIGSTLGLFAMNGAKVSLNYHDPDFLKIKVKKGDGLMGALMATPGMYGIGVQTYNGETRYDVAGGLIQYLRVAARVSELTAKTVKEVATTGEASKAKYGVKTGADMVGDFFRNKTSPLVGMAWDLLDGKNSVGQPFAVKKELIDHFTSLFAQDVYDSAAGGGGGKGTPSPYTGDTPDWLHEYQSKNPAPKTSSLSLIPTASAAPPQKEEQPDWLKEYQGDSTAPDWLKAAKADKRSNDLAKGLLEDLGAKVTDSGLRLRSTQEKLYSEYSGVAKPGDSGHEKGRAIDIAPPDNLSVEEIKKELEDNGYYGVKIITKRHGSGPHWHVGWEGRK